MLVYQRKELSRPESFSLHWFIVQVELHGCATFPVETKNIIVHPEFVHVSLASPVSFKKDVKVTFTFVLRACLLQSFCFNSESSPPTLSSTNPVLYIISIFFSSTASFRLKKTTEVVLKRFPLSWKKTALSELNIDTKKYTFLKSIKIKSKI